MKAGDIILVHSMPSLLAKAITHFMEQEADKLGLDLPYPVPHHAGTIIQYNGQLRVAEAVARGYVATPLLEAYTRKEWANNVVLLTPKKPYTPNEQSLISSLAQDMAMRGKPYDYPNFIFQIIYVKTGIWIGPKEKKSEMAVYCSEGAALLADYVQPGVFPRHWEVNPVMIAASKDFVIKSIGVEL